jgi:hypothetical protein
VSHHALWNLTSLNASPRACVASTTKAFQLAFFAGCRAAILLPCLQTHEKPPRKAAFLVVVELEIS